MKRYFGVFLAILFLLLLVLSKVSVSERDAQVTQPVTKNLSKNF